MLTDEIKVTTQLTVREEDDLELSGKAQYKYEGP